MADNVRKLEVGEPSDSSLVSGIVHDTEKLVKYGVELAKFEILEEWGRRKAAGVAYGMGAGALGIAVVLFCIMLAHLLNAAIAIPLWIGYALVTIALGLAGFACFAVGKRKLEHKPK